jgi:hypothetical protein
LHLIKRDISALPSARVENSTSWSENHAEPEGVTIIGVSAEAMQKDEKTPLSSPII